MPVYTIRCVTKIVTPSFYFFFFSETLLVFILLFLIFSLKMCHFFSQLFLVFSVLFGNKKPGSRRAFLLVSSIINVILFSVYFFFFPSFCFPPLIIHLFFYDLLCFFEAIEHFFIEVLAEVIKCLQHSGFLDLEVDHLVGCKR